MNREWPIAIHCGDAPFQNLTSEGPEIFAWTAIGYCCEGSLKMATSIISQTDANRALNSLLVTDCPLCEGGRKDGGGQKYCADASCPDGTGLTTICVTTSQEDADTLAAKAKAQMLPYCDNKDEMYQANCACPDGVTDPHTVYSNLSQEIAQAQCDFIPKDCPGAPSAGASCTVKCADGTSFTYILPAGSVTAPTQEEADAIAKALACAEAEKQKMCLAPLPRCACANMAFSARIDFLEGARASTWTISSGALPTGLNFIGFGTYAVISGTPTVSGNFIFAIRATDASGNYAEKLYELDILQITTASLPDYTVGTAYSHQLLAAGGSGNYQWSIQSGALPDGLTLSGSGLISGTPTGADSGVMPVTFAFVDLLCEIAQASNFPPRATLVTTSTTTTRTKRGWFAFGTNSGTLYKRFDVTGSHTQTAQTAPLIDPASIGLVYCGGAKQTYSGFCKIDLYGNVINLHQKALIVDCDKEPYPLVQEAVGGGTEDFIWASAENVTTLLGYCWNADPESCDACSATETDWKSKGNYAQANSEDIPWNMLINRAFLTSTATVLSYDGTTTSFYDRIVREDLSPPIGFPKGSTNVYHIIEAWVRITSTGKWSITLSEPYTDAEAAATQTVINGLGSVANGGVMMQWATQYVKHVAIRTTAVSFAIHCRNLVIGQTYDVSYELWNETTNSKSTVTTSFMAVAETHDITGNVPTPLFGQSIKIRKVTIHMT